MIRWAEENADKGEVESEVVFRFLGKVPGWGEKNFQVCAMSILCMWQLSKISGASS